MILKIYKNEKRIGKKNFREPNAKKNKNFKYLKFHQKSIPISGPLVTYFDENMEKLLD